MGVDIQTHPNNKPKPQQPTTNNKIPKIRPIPKIPVQTNSPKPCSSNKNPTAGPRCTTSAKWPPTTSFCPLHKQGRTRCPSRSEPRTPFLATTQDPASTDHVSQTASSQTSCRSCSPTSARWTAISARTATGYHENDTVSNPTNSQKPLTNSSNARPSKVSS